MDFGCLNAQKWNAQTFGVLIVIREAHAKPSSAYGVSYGPVYLPFNIFYHISLKNQLLFGKINK